MRHPVLAGLLLPALLVSAAASAAPVALGGSISIEVGGLPPIGIPVVTSVGDLTGGTLTVPAGIASTAGLFVPVTGFPLNLITGIVVTASNGAGSFAVPGPADGGPAFVLGGGFGGRMPILGVAQIKGALAINVPLSVAGQGGAVNSGGILVEGAPWTTGKAKVTFSVGAPVVRTGSKVGAIGELSSTLTLVTPVYINVAGGLAQLPVFASWTQHWPVPEPGTLLLVASGLAALGAGAQRRRTTSRR